MNKKNREEQVLPSTSSGMTSSQMGRKAANIDADYRKQVMTGKRKLGTENEVPKQMTKYCRMLRKENKFMIPLAKKGMRTLCSQKDDINSSRNASGDGYQAMAPKFHHKNATLPEIYTGRKTNNPVLSNDNRGCNDRQFINDFNKQGKGLAVLNANQNTPLNTRNNIHEVGFATVNDSSKLGLKRKCNKHYSRPPNSSNVKNSTKVATKPPPSSLGQQQFCRTLRNSNGASTSRPIENVCKSAVNYNTSFQNISRNATGTHIINQSQRNTKTPLIGKPSEVNNVEQPRKQASVQQPNKEFDPIKETEKIELNCRHLEEILKLICSCQYLQNVKKITIKSV